jgi:hypothetical protein
MFTAVIAGGVFVFLISPSGWNNPVIMLGALFLVAGWIYAIDELTTVYQLDNSELLVLRPILPFLTKRYKIKQFTAIEHHEIRGRKVVIFRGDQGQGLLIHLEGTAPELIKRICSICHFPSLKKNEN